MTLKITLKQQVLADLAAGGLSPLHRLGQNFMIDEHALACLLSELAVTTGTRVVEVGPGTGILTTRLLEAGCTVLAVELDRGMAQLLSASLVPRGLTLVHGDCLENKNTLHPAICSFATQPWRLGANLPYDVALPVLLNAAALVAPALQPESVVVTVQYEAAVRLCSRPGDDAWGASAAVLQAAGTPRIVRRLSPNSFHPQPRVDSAILRWQPRQILPPGFGRWCRTIFAARRKVLVRALRDAGIDRAVAEAACAACALDTTRRLESLDAPELRALFLTLPALAPVIVDDEGTAHE